MKNQEVFKSHLIHAEIRHSIFESVYLVYSYRGVALLIPPIGPEVNSCPNS